MKKLILVAMLLMGTVALGVAQETQRGSLTLVDATASSVTIQVTAGSEGTPYGFLINWAQPHQGKHNVTFDGSSCPEYSLPPFGSVEVTIDGLRGSSCVINEQPWPVMCDTNTRFLGRLIGLGTKMSGFTTFTDACQ